MPLPQRFGSPHAFWLVSAVVMGACSTKKIDFFEPPGFGGAGAVAGSGGSMTSGGASSGGSDPTGGTASTQTGGTGASAGAPEENGGTTGMGGSGALAGMGGTAGAAPGGTGGSGAGAGGAGAGGAGTGGSGAAGSAGTGGAGGGNGCVPTSERCDGIDNNCVNGVDEGACPDGCVGRSLGTSTYVLCSFETGMGNRSFTWPQASEFCTARAMHLVQIDGLAENQLIQAWATSENLGEELWMGANDRDDAVSPLLREGNWVWGSGSGAVPFWLGTANGMPVGNRYSDWANGEPNNMGNEDCGLLHPAFDWQWDDRACTAALPNFVCESS